jgi:RecA/RadA recombinase
MGNKWLEQLRAYDDSVDYQYDSFATQNCLYTPSPYFNWIFANKSGGIPKNASILFYSEQKAGKSLSIYAIILEMQKREDEFLDKKGKHIPDDEKSHAIIFNTELRGQLQHDVFPAIDKDRMTIYDTKDPVEIFDRIENDIKAMVQDGFPLRIIAIDSLTNIQGVKRKDAESVGDHLVGDHALTVQIGLDKLVPFCKRNKILLIGTEQMRDKMDASKYESKIKSAATWATKHTFEYQISLKRAGAAEDKADIDGKTFEEDIKDARDNKLLTGHKIYVKMEGSSLGPQMRSGVFTVDYKKGIINQHEEVFFLGKNTGVIKLEGQTYNFGNYKARGQANFATTIKDTPELYKAILDSVIKLDDKE